MSTLFQLSISLLWLLFFYFNRAHFFLCREKPDSPLGLHGKARPILGLWKCEGPLEVKWQVEKTLNNGFDPSNEKGPTEFGLKRLGRGVLICGSFLQDLKQGLYPLRQGILFFPLINTQ